MKQEEMAPSELAKMTIVYAIPEMEAVTVRREVPYCTTESGSLTFDVYYPPGAAAADRRPAVLIVYGYSDAGMPNVFGRTFKEMGQTVSWARLIAASGLVAILYSNREPVSDAQRVLQHLREHAADLGIDGRRLGLVYLTYLLHGGAWQWSGAPVQRRQVEVLDKEPGRI